MLKRNEVFVMAFKIILLLVFAAITLGIGFYTKSHATDVNGFVLGGRTVGPGLRLLPTEHPIFPRLSS